MSDPISSLQSNRFDVFRYSLGAICFVALGALTALLIQPSQPTLVSMVNGILTAIGSLAGVALVGGNVHDAVVRTQMVKSEERKAVAVTNATGDLGDRPKTGTTGDLPPPRLP